MKILPNKAPTVNKEKIIPRASEWAWDFVTWDFKKKNGRMYKVYDDEAIKIWMWKLFLTERFRWLIHSDTYGAEHRTLIGRGYTAPYINALAEQMTRDAIENNLSNYVKNVRPVDSQTPFVFFKNGVLYITFYADTIYNKDVIFSVVYNTFN